MGDRRVENAEQERIMVSNSSHVAEDETVVADVLHLQTN